MDLLRRTANSAHLLLRRPFSLREKDRMRAGITVLCPHPGPLPEGEGEKQYALFTGLLSIIGFSLRSLRNIHGRIECRGRGMRRSGRCGKNSYQSNHFRLVALLLQPFLAVGGALFHEHHVHDAVGAVAALDLELHQPPGHRPQ